MSEFAVEGDAINVHGTVLEPAEPVSAEPETQAGAEPDEHLKALEAQPGDFLAGYKHAAEVAGLAIEYEPGEPEYVEWAQAEIAALQEQSSEMLRAANAVADQAKAEGNTELAEYAAAIAERLNAHVELAEFERQTEAENREYEFQAAVSEGESRIGQWANETAELVGVDPESIDGARVMQIATDAFGSLIESHGMEFAAQAVPDLIQRAVAIQSDETEQGMQQAFETAQKLVHDLGGRAKPEEVTRIASEVYQRALYRSGGDHTEALRESMLGAAKSLAGFSDKTQPQPHNTSLVASMHATIDKEIPRERTPQPKIEAQLDRARDPRTGQFVARPLAEKYAYKPTDPKQELAERQKAALKQAFGHLAVNR